MKIAYKKSLFKVIGASALATCMLATSLFAFIPNPTQAETLNSNQTPSSTQTTTPTTESTGLITPRADDPVLFTTESGLKIKYGNLAINPNLESGKLSGYPYITTNDGTKDYFWVMIGANFKSDNSPAGEAINSSSGFELQHVWGKLVSEFINYNDEIPSLSGLFVANDVLASGTFGLTEVTFSHYASNGSGQQRHYYASYGNSTIDQTMCGYYEDGTFGLLQIKNKIKEVPLGTSGSEGVKTSQSQLCCFSYNRYVFPLGACPSYSKFVFYRYVSQVNFYNTSTAQWTHDVAYLDATDYTTTPGSYYAKCYYVMESKSSSGKYYTDNVEHSESAGYRPAFIMSLV